MVVGYDRYAKITSIVIPESISIDAGTIAATYSTGDYSLFYGSYEVTYIGQRAFAVDGNTPYDAINTPNLQSVTLPSTLKVIGDEAFLKQCDIAKIVIPDSVMEIGDNAFTYMANPAQGNTNPFSGCSGANQRGVTEIVVGSGVRGLHGSVFRSNSFLTKLSFRGSGPELFSSITEYPTALDNWQTSGTGRSYVVSGQTWAHCTSQIVYMGGSVTLSVLSQSSQAWIDWGTTGNCLPSGANRSVVVSRFTPSQPAAPTPTNATLTSVDLSFTAPASNGGSPVDYYEITTLPATATTTVTGELGGTVVISGLTPSTSYKFKVSAHNAAQVASGNLLAYAGGISVASPSSIAISTLAPFAPGAPTIGTVAGTSATTVSIPYTAGAINGSAITEYTTTSSDPVSLTLTSAATANPLTYSGTFVQGQAYTFSMTATNGAGISSPSSASNSITPYAAAAPAAGIIGSATSSSATTVSIPFTAPSSNGSAITAYTVTSLPALTLTYSGTTSPMAVTGAFVQGQSYTFTIAATNGAGTGGASSASNSVTPFAPGNPDAPTIGVATTVDSQTVTVSFSAPTNNRGSAITSYTATSNPGGITGTSSTSPITVTGLTVNTPYTFTVTATNGVGTSDSSTATSAVTPRMVYSVIFDSQGGSTVSNGSFISGSSVSAAPTSPTRSGYTFNGWFAASTGGSALVFPYSPGVTSNITVYAQWTLIPVVVPPAPTPTPVVVSGPPPSTLKTITSPKISRDEKGYYCEIGKYVFLREGRTEETPKLSSQVFMLLLNGKVIDTLKSALDKVSFTKSDSFFNSTLACQVEVGQENLSTTSYSLNSDAMASHSLTKKKAIEAADAKYYKDRQDAYAKKELEFARLATIKATAVTAAKSSKEILAASANYQKAFAAASELWKKELAEASVNRVLAKELAQMQYLDALEAAGISIYPVAIKTVATPTPAPTPITTTTPTPTPSPTATNVQPTVAMEKIGTLYMATGSYFLNDAAKISLRALALKINSSDANQVLVYGHTDARGGVNNTLLSRNRAKAVSSFLKPLLRNKKLVIGWYASKKPLTTGTSKSDLAKNRRVEIYTK
jgi:uncharacterized repeat protein (TIGR02543 family)